jgi:hypothetical protein
MFAASPSMTFKKYNSIYSHRKDTIMIARTPLVESKKRNAPRRRIGDELAFIRAEQARISTEGKIDRDLPQHVEDDLRKTVLV